MTGHQHFLVRASFGRTYPSVRGLFRLSTSIKTGRCKLRRIYAQLVHRRLGRVLVSAVFFPENSVFNNIIIDLIKLLIRRQGKSFSQAPGSIPGRIPRNSKFAPKS